MGYWTGLVEGFQGRREAEYKKNYERELQNRQMSDRVFTYLLNSRDPEMQQMALQGLMQPIQKKKGFAGFMNEIDPSAQPFLENVVGRINEMVPDTSFPSAPPPPPSGAAAMSPNQPVHAGSAPIEGTPVPTEEPVLSRPIGSGEVMAASPDAQVTAPAIVDQSPMAGPTGPGPGPVTGLPPGAPTGMPGPPGPPPMKRRGTGVPNAEEIALQNARATMQGRIEAARTALTQAGATPEEIESAIMGIAGAPRSPRFLQAVSGWGVKVPGSDVVQPVLLDTTGRGYVLPGGESLPPGSQMVRMSGGTGGGALTSSVRDSPETRQQLLAMGADPQVLNNGTATGYWRIRQDLAGNMLVQPGEYTPPTALTGTLEAPDPTLSTVPTRVGVTRSGTVTPPLADVATTVKSDYQRSAEAFRAAVDAEMDLMLKNPIARLNATPQQRDAIVKQKAAAAGLPFQTYDDVLRAIQTTPEVTPRTQATGGTTAEKVRAAANAARAQRGGAAPATPPPAAPPPGPPVRSRGPGPRR